MGTPKTRIPKAIRRDVRAALECFRDYLLACDNKSGALAMSDLTELLGLEPLPHLSCLDNARYWNPALRALVNNRKEYGSK